MKYRETHHDIIIMFTKILLHHEMSYLQNVKDGINYVHMIQLKCLNTIITISSYMLTLTLSERWY
jgi:hypothetical protein